MSNNAVPATPAMVEQMEGLEEADIPKDEKVPLNQNQADPSPAASPEGAPAEPTGSQTEAQPSAPPAVPAVTPQPATAPAQLAAVEAKPEDEAAALTKLTDWVAEQNNKVAEESRRAAQSAADKQESQFQKMMEASSANQTQLQQQVRELQARDLTDEERAKLQVAWEQDDREAQLTQAATKLDAGYRDVTIMSLLTEYKDTDIKRSDLEAIEDLEEMELYCEQQTNVSLREKLTEMQQSAEAAPAEPPSAPTPAASEAQPNVPGVPAGATAQSDVGTGGTSPDGKKFSEEPNSEALHDNLKNMEWTAPRVRQG